MARQPAPGDRSAAPRVPTDTSPGGVYSSLRHQALTLRWDDLGLPERSPDAPIFAVLMEVGYPDATATLLAVLDGTTSLYLSTGGGVLGGQDHATVREANAELLEVANAWRGELRPTTRFPVPAAGEATFYALTPAGVLTASATQDELDLGDHPLSDLFVAGHDVLTELRLIAEGPEGE